MTASTTTTKTTMKTTKTDITDTLYDVEILSQTSRSVAHIVAKIRRTLLYDAVTALDTTPGLGGFWSEPEPTGLVVTFSTADFTNLPYPDRSFDLGIHDPPHCAGLGKGSYFAGRYGTYSCKDQRRIITAGVRETWRCSAIGALIKVTDHVNSARYKRRSGWVIDAIGQEPYAAVVVVRGEVGSNRWSGGDWAHEWQSARSVSSTLLVFRRGSQEHSQSARVRRMAAMAARLEASRAGNGLMQ
jgi:hypothetical protein